MRINVNLPISVQQIDETGYMWTFLSRASDPSAVCEGALLVAGHPDDPCLVRVISVTPTPDGDAVVRLDDVAAGFDEVVAALESAGLRVEPEPTAA